jgi:hypothetical protein
MMTQLHQKVTFRTEKVDPLHTCIRETHIKLYLDWPYCLSLKKLFPIHNNNILSYSYYKILQEKNYYINYLTDSAAKGAYTSCRAEL